MARPTQDGRYGDPEVQGRRESDGDADTDDVDARVTVPEDAASALGQLRQFLAFVGPGFLISVAYLDPGNIETDLRAGLDYGHSLLWVLLWATAAGWMIQTLAVRLGLGSGVHLARACREEYGFHTRIALWAATEVGIVAADVPEVIGTALALKLLFGLPTPVGVVLAAGSTLVFLAASVLGARVLESVIGVLVAAISLCFIAQNVAMGHGWTTAVATAEGLAVPRIASPGALLAAISLLGAVVMPHNLYLHSALVLTRGADRVPAAAALRWNALECGIALAGSLAVNVCVVGVAAAVATSESVADPAALAELDARPLQNIPRVLATLLGHGAVAAFAVALLASGVSATMTGTLAGQYVVDGFLQLRLPSWARSLVTRSLAVVPALAVALIAGDGAAERLVVICSVILSFQLPFALIPLLKFCTCPAVVRDMVLGPVARAVAVALTVAIVGANATLLAVAAAQSGAVDGSPAGIGAGVALAGLSGAYLAALAALALKPVTWDGVLPHGERHPRAGESHAAGRGGQGGGRPEPKQGAEESGALLAETAE